MTGLPGIVWDRITSGLTRLDAPEVTAVELVLILVAAVGLAVPKLTWKYFGMFTTVIHELGHAVAALTTFQMVTGIKLHLNHGGTTNTYGPGGIRAVWSAFWGYPVPAVVGATLVWAGLQGWSSAALSVSCLVLMFTLLLIRNAEGLLILGSVLAISLLLVLFAGPVFLGHTTLVIGIAMLVGAVRDLGKVIHVHFRRRTELESSDAYILFRQTMIPSPVWLFGFAAVTAVSWFLALGFVIEAVG
ncbi:M50 family metallopeptidase [Arthrobacter sp. zg-Y1110]|uniref:M50 family metallopeptidase n=1 Tax=Arthrobacter sp. zg-Y1110 TaxID=2886932 RepID=UPI001D14D6D5|nr:M50 family metallopeptidase [Arthrobacter sp. zg-Y1110]MCC3292496.1 M50 family metallopeptidase [Arthrobacter sp. zg-Y1110]UWX87072.1 M50 family metallopeptidase [Arthrobacter sp. zg-Y1110]